MAGTGNIAAVTRITAMSGEIMNIDEPAAKMAPGGKRAGAGRPRKPAEERRVTKRVTRDLCAECARQPELL